MVPLSCVCRGSRVGGQGTRKHAPASERDDVKGGAAYRRAGVTAGNKGQAVH